MHGTHVDGACADGNAAAEVVGGCQGGDVARNTGAAGAARTRTDYRTTQRTAINGLRSDARNVVRTNEAEARACLEGVEVDHLHIGIAQREQQLFAGDPAQFELRTFSLRCLVGHRRLGGEVRSLLLVDGQGKVQGVAKQAALEADFGKP